MPYFKVWCPCPENVHRGQVAGATVCSKGTALMAKGTNRDALLDRVRNHLMNSPYHLLTEEQADVQMQVTEDFMEEWDSDDEAPNYPSSRGAHAEAGGEERVSETAERRGPERRDRPDRLRSPVPRGSAAADSGRGSSGGSRRSSSRPRRSRSRRDRRSPDTPEMGLQMVPSSASSRPLPSSATVTIRMTEFQMICDSIRRAALNVRNAEQLCDRAAQAFRLEATALEAAHAALMMNIVHR